MALVPLEIWDQNGVPLFKFGTRVARQFGYFDTTAGNGSRFVDVLAQQNSWFVCSPRFGGTEWPAITRNGGTISWEIVGNPNNDVVRVRVYYGML
ncbi:hypothetical protein ACM1PE_09045 [Achromobacter sp. PD1]|jgi:hypothetical protein|uniref:hypothetical protein n=1 Tax=Achromobacter TaxID=222 RepID=UPI0007514809|nr:hypothetical protein [Achromobacter aegrifaciens]WLW63690.1 hypothetical protein RA224_09770 [Achromobacter aegrifaciens]